MTTYDIHQPRISITHPKVLEGHTFHPVCELGQASAMGEAMFFCSLGYTVNISRWDGKRFTTEEKYYPDDL